MDGILVHITHPFRSAVLCVMERGGGYCRRNGALLLLRKEETHHVEKTGREENVAVHVSNEVRRVEEPCRQNHVLQNGQSVHIHCKGGHDADRVILAVQADRL